MSGSRSNTKAYPTGGYFNLFRSSDALLTDSGSFLGEYLPTGKPVIWMVSKRPGVRLNMIGEEITATYYQIRTREELVETFERVILRGDDWMKEARLAVRDRLFAGSKPAACQIIDHLETVLQPQA